MTSALQYITNIDTSFPKPGQDNPSQGFRSNFSNIQRALSDLNSYMDSLAATTLNVEAPSVTATQNLTALNFLTIGSQTSITIGMQGFSDLIAIGTNADGSKGSGLMPMFLHVLPIGRYSYGTDATYGAYFVTISSISRVIVGATFFNLDKSIEFTVTRVSIGDNRVYFTPSSTDLPATVDIINPPLGGGYNAFKQTLGSILPYGSIILWYGSIASIPQGWILCDGRDGSPDLRNRFVVCAGENYNVGDTGGSADAIVVSHNHQLNDPGHNHDFEQITSGPWQGRPRGVSGNQSGADGDLDGSMDITGYDKSSVEVNIAINETDISINPAGDSGIDANLPPYYALCYIMKVI